MRPGLNRDGDQSGHAIDSDRFAVRLAAVVLLQTGLLLAAGLLGQQTGGLVRVGHRGGQRFVHMAAPPAAHEIERMEHVDHGARVHVAHELDDVLALIGRYDSVQQVHPVTAVSTDDLGAADAVLEVVDVGGHDLVCQARRDLQRHAVVAMVEAVDGLGRDELEDDGVRRVVPSEHLPEDDQDEAIEGEDRPPDGLACVIGDPQGDEVGSARRSAGLEGDGNGQARDHAAEDDEHDLVAQKRAEVEDVEEQRGQGDLRHGEQHEASADAVPAHGGDGDIECEHAERGVDVNAAERGDAVDEDCHAGKTARQQVGGLDEGLDEERLNERRDRDGDRGDDAADDREAREFERAIGECVDGVCHGSSFEVGIG